MRIFFDRQGVERLLAHVYAAPAHKATYAETAKKKQAEPALWLVGDQGVYLMSNGDPGMPQGSNAVYAKGIDPNKDSDWYQRKRDFFGGDDGVEALPAVVIAKALKTYKPDRPLIIAMNRRSISVIWYQTKKTA